MADLRSVTYGATTFTIPSGGEYEARIAALETSVTALEALLANHTDVRLTLTDESGGSTSYDMLGKRSYTNAFDLPDGVFDASGNRLGNLTDGYEEDPETTDFMVYTQGSSWGTDIDAVYVDRILAAYPTASGIALSGVGYVYDAAFKNATSGALDFIVFTGAGYEGYPQYGTVLFDGAVTDAVGTIYTKTTTGAPWGQTSATVNDTGTGLPWVS